MSEAHIRRRWQLTALGVLLCVLAALFAIEAKLAWYGPQHTPTLQISSSKLQPAEAPRLVANALAASHLMPHFPEIVKVLTVALVIGVPVVAAGLVTARQQRPVSPSFTPLLFFRPPPPVL